MAREAAGTGLHGGGALSSKRVCRILALGRLDPSGVHHPGRQASAVMKGIAEARQI